MHNGNLVNPPYSLYLPYVGNIGSHFHRMQLHLGLRTEIAIEIS